MKRLQMTIIGKVQGISFRSFVKQRAIELGLKGYVKNVDDKLEVVAEGNDDRLKDLLDLCNKGPARAEVEFVQMEWKDYQGEFKKFEVRYTESMK
ncbi:MAG: acylphosphatase [Nanoarchaeota archaeon]|nr:acylphosphatase [Nanoarchaeota archaeon]